MKVTIMELAALRKSVIVLVSLALLLSVAAMHSASVSAAFSSHQGDFFKYTETTDLGNGTGNYAGYTEHQDVTGGENVTGVSGNTVSMNYGYTYDWSNSSGSTLTGNRGGPYTFSETTFLYLNGTDNETSFGGVKYVNPAVWFAMNNSLPDGANFTLLNTPIKIMSSNYPLYLAPESKSVLTIFAQGGGTYQRNDVYGQFSAAYTWSAWYDPSTGYIVGYNYVEHDTNPSGDGFDYTDKLYVASSSYPLTATIVTSSSIQTTSSEGLTTSSSLSSSAQTITIPVEYIDIIVLIVIVLVAIFAVLAILRRRRMAEVKDMDTGTRV
jgi:hypothetical protein